MLALSIYTLSARLVTSRPLRALAAFLGAQPALLFAYSLWSGIKELAAAALIALVCAAVAATIGRWDSLRATIPAALAAAALFAVLSPAGGVWLAAPVLVVSSSFSPRLSSSVRVVVVLVALIAVLSIPSISIARSFVYGASGGEITRARRSRTSDIRSTASRRSGSGRPRTSAAAAQLVGDVRPHRRPAARGRGRGPVRRAPTSLGDASLRGHRRCRDPAPLRARPGQPELAVAEREGDGRGVTGAGRGRHRRCSGGVRDRATDRSGGHRGPIAAGVLWSNGLAYSSAWLAPRAQLAELQAIGHATRATGRR